MPAKDGKSPGAQNRLEQLEAIRHGALERLRFIDVRLFWDGRINRADLIERFGVSPAQAALDFRDYLALSPPGVAYDTRAKAYRTGDGFKPVFGIPDAESTLANLTRDGDPAAYQLPALKRPLDAAIAARIRRATGEHEKLHIIYQSLTRPAPSERWIAPARLISDGDRWHVRAWCFERESWRDFVLGRIVAIGAAKPVGDLPPDREWLETVEIVLRPSALLSPAQEAAVAGEFAMTGGRLTIAIPAAMRIYAVSHWGLDRPNARLEIASETRTKP
ncbi:MAG: WYL domain-containing protein [Hyphomicrobiaceae bacterium]|nr:WYL domain-containing protein [Hyphomicrobiaceae bacterium]